VRNEPGHHFPDPIDASLTLLGEKRLQGRAFA
jgi:hypothetical protein